MGSTSTATVLLCVILLATKDRSFVSTAPVGDEVSAGQGRNSQEQVQDADVSQLESLKRSLGETLSLIKTQSAVYANVDGHRQSHSDVREEVDSNGKLVARVGKQVDSETGGGGDLTPSTKVQTEIDIPSKGIHRVDVQQQPRQEITDNGNRRDIIPDLTRDISNNLEKYTSYSGVQYSPLDMAEYVFWTGDEKGVTLAIEEFLQDGLMNRDEAIAFLQEIKYNLDYLQTHYSQQGLHPNSDTQHREQSKEPENSIQKIGRFMDEQNLQSSRMQMLQDNKHIYDIADLRENMDKKNTIETLPVLVQNPINKEEVTPKSNSAEDSISDEEYEVLLERLRVADFLYTQYSLEEVIYQLAKVMFSQSLTRGSAEAQEALQKFTTFLESETEQGHISRSLEKKVLDVLIAALTDTLTEHPELVAAAREGLSGGGTPHLPAGNNILQQLLELGPDEKMMAKSTMRGGMPFKQQNQINREHLQSSDRVKLPPVGLGKYKTH